MTRESAARPASWLWHDLTITKLLRSCRCGEGARKGKCLSLDDEACSSVAPSGSILIAILAVTLLLAMAVTAHAAASQAAGPLPAPAMTGFKGPASLAAALPARKDMAPFVRYAAVGKAQSHPKAARTRLDWRINTAGRPTGCLPSDLRLVLNEVAAKFGPITLNSTVRSHSHNRRVGGASRSLHLDCRAIDFKYHGSRRGALIKFLRNHWAVGGLGNYGRGGHIHIDDGPRKSW